MDNDFEKNDHLGRLMAQEFITELERIDREKTAATSAGAGLYKVKSVAKMKKPRVVLKKLLEKKAPKVVIT